MKKIIMNIVLVVALMMTGVTVYSENSDYRILIDNRGNGIECKVGTLYINGNKVDAYDSALFYEGGALFPMRRIFESLGAQVDWNADDRSTYIKYNGEEYVCTIRVLKADSPKIEVLGIQNTKNIGNDPTGGYIRLNPMGYSGSFCVIDDATYLHEDTGERLFKALGCKVEVDSDMRTISIYY